MEFSPLSIDETQGTREGVKILKLTGPVTIHNFARFQELTQKHLLPPVLLVDLSGVPYIDSSALGSFVALHVSCEANKSLYSLVAANDRLKGLFDLSYVHSFLIIHDSTAEAESHLLKS